MTSLHVLIIYLMTFVPTACTHANKTIDQVEQLLRYYAVLIYKHDV